ncbi:aromatic ring-hydroxylating dioxygenase subunit alpha [Saccharomonospora sp. NPDC046836]|uniref:aromatic ring-hydroxylating dioxygenase subunit alpha n=1 Tax=Saccharomonospora sp. NPDC046836 TaxID=3156921 RepID=UPI0033EDEE67
MAIDPDELKTLVDWENGQISPRIFIDEEIYRQELAQVFDRAWLFLAHDSMIPEPNDFFSTYMGGDPVIVSRLADGSVTAFLNACRHRGMKVCRAEDGNAKSFMCTYHGWTYDNEGKLINVPMSEEAYLGDLDYSQNGLLKVAQIDSYRGLHFATFDPEAPPLLDYLGDMTFYLDSFLDQTPGGIEFLPGVIKWTIHGNWKMGAEQFGGDAYHAVITHASSFGAYNKRRDRDSNMGEQAALREGHTTGYSLAGTKSELRDILRHEDGEHQPSDDWEAEKLAIAEQRLGPERAKLRGHMNVFPNFSGLPGQANLRIWHPKGPNKFEIWSFTVVDKDAPDEVKRGTQLSATVTEGAAGVVESDDGENWDLIGQLLEQGHRTREMKWNYTMGIGKEDRMHAGFPGKLSRTIMSEGPQRAFYRRWLEFMTSAKWPYTPKSAQAAPNGTGSATVSEHAR